MTRSEQLIKEIKLILENEVNETELDEMARKAFNNMLTEKGKADITAAVAKMDEEDEAGKAEHKKTFIYKALAELAKAEVGEAILTTKIQDASGCKYPQPINKLLTQLKDAGYLTRATSHVEPEKDPNAEPKKKGRPAGPEKPKADKPSKAKDLLNLGKKSDIADDTVAEELNENEIEEASENLEELNFNSLEKKLTDEFGIDGNKKGDEGSLEEMELGGAQTNPTEDTRDNQSAIHPINEQLALMQFRAGLITDTEYRKRIGLDKLI